MVICSVYELYMTLAKTVVCLKSPLFLPVLLSQTTFRYQEAMELMVVIVTLLQALFYSKVPILSLTIKYIVFLDVMCTFEKISCMFPRLTFYSVVFRL